MLILTLAPEGNEPQEPAKSQSPFGFGADSHFDPKGGTRALSLRSQSPFGFGADSHSAFDGRGQLKSSRSLNRLSALVLILTTTAYG